MLPYTKFKQEKHGKLKLEQITWGGNLIRINDDLEDYFSEALLYEITELWNDGYSIEGIAELYERNPDEIFLALFHQARNDKTSREFGFRVKEQKGRGIDGIREIFSDSKRA